MHKLLKAGLVVVAAAALAANAFAATQTTAKKKAVYHTASGEIQSYDGTAHTLTLKSTTGSTTFQVATDAKVWSGKQSLALDQLGSHTGGKATVSYTESGGQKTTHTIRLSTSPPAKTTK